MLDLGSIPHPVMGTTKDYGRNFEALVTPYLQSITAAGVDLSRTPFIGPLVMRIAETSLNRKPQTLDSKP